jgi:AraC-like DNA-binding protein
VKYVERAAVVSLSPYVECIWAVSAKRHGRAAERIVPDGCPEIIVHLGDPFERLIGKRWRRQPRAFLAGTLTRPLTVRGGGHVLTIGLRFRPAGFTALFGGSLAGTADHEVPLGNLVGADRCRDLVARLDAARSVPRRLDAAMAWLVEQRPRDGAVTASAPALRLIVRARGQMQMVELARRLDVSRRQLERSFLRDLGIGPKMYARIVRLNTVLARLDEVERASAVDVALQAGYFDQAHLLRDFRLLAGRSPRRGNESDGQLARHFIRPARLRPLFLGE